MPLNSLIDKINSPVNEGHLYIVATPIGNLSDITLRAIAVLERVDMIAAEDTRATSRLLNHYAIKTKLISYHEHNENQRTPQLIEQLNQGKSIALVSDAGTPTISDPGYRLVHAAASANIPVVPIPGVCAALAALSASGLPTDSYTFAGFPPKKPGRQVRYLQDLMTEPRTLIFYESPKRMLSFINSLLGVMGDRPAVLTRELTKIHEEFLRGRLSEIKQELIKRDQIKGECTLLVAGNVNDNKEISDEILRAEIETALASDDAPLTVLSKKIAQKYGLSKQKVYSIALQLKD